MREQEIELLRKNNLPTEPKKWRFSEALYIYGYFNNSEFPNALILPDHVNYVVTEGYEWRKRLPDVIAPESGVILDALVRMDQLTSRRKR